MERECDTNVHTKCGGRSNALVLLEERGRLPRVKRMRRREEGEEEREKNHAQNWVFLKNEQKLSRQNRWWGDMLGRAW